MRMLSECMYVCVSSYLSVLELEPARQTQVSLQTASIEAVVLFQSRKIPWYFWDISPTYYVQVKSQPRIEMIHCAWQPNLADFHNEGPLQL